MHGAKSYVPCDDEGQIQEAHLDQLKGLDYPGVGPGALVGSKDSGARDGIGLRRPTIEALAAAYLMAKTEGIVPALETSHAFAKVASIARELAAKRGRAVTLVVASSGRGDSGPSDAARAVGFGVLGESAARKEPRDGTH